MRPLRATLAFAFGFVAFLFIWIWFGGFMAARSIPAGYFRFFASIGPIGKELGLAVLGFALHLVPTLVLVVAAAWIATRLASADRRAVLLSVLAGVASAYVFALIAYPVPGASGLASFVLSLQQVFLAPWWVLPSSLAPWVAIGAAYALLARRTPPPASA